MEGKRRKIMKYQLDFPTQHFIFTFHQPKEREEKNKHPA
jgi:hypothetical protein